MSTNDNIMIDEDLEDEEVIINDTKGTGIDLSELEEELNEANNQNTLELCYIYHVYNISVKHVPFFNTKYNEHIIGWVLHKPTSEDTTFYTGESKRYNNKITGEKIICSSKTHIHVLIKLPERISYYKATNNPESKWYGFQTYSKELTRIDDKYLTRQDIWKEKFIEQEPYKTILITTEQHYINLLKYLTNRLEVSTKGNIDKYQTFTPDKYLYSKKDNRDDKHKPIIEKSISIDIQSDDIIEKAKHTQTKHLEELEVNYSTYKKMFIDKGFNTLAEWQATNGLASNYVKKIFTDGKRSEKDRKCKPLDTEETIKLETMFPLTTNTIKLILFHITMKRVEKDVFLILQGPTSCGKSSISTAVADAYPLSFECNSMNSFLHRDNLGMEHIATRCCESIICDEFNFIDNTGNGHKQVQDQLKQYLSGKEISVRVRKNTKEELNDTTRIKLIIACCNNDNKRITDVNAFLKDNAVKERTIKVIYLSSYLELFKEEKKPSNQLPLQEFSRYSIKIRLMLEALIEKITKDSIQKIQELMKNVWYLNNYLEISYNSPHAMNILDRLHEDYNINSFTKITNDIVDYSDDDSDID